ncbi:MAG: histidine kinase, partial [Owenweeksia sp.]
KIGDVYLEQDRPEEAVDMYNQNIKVAEELNEPKEIGRANDKIARIYTESNRLDDALNLRERSIAIYNLSGDTALLANEYLERGKIENELNQVVSAQKSLELALKLAQASGQKQTEREAYREISALAEKQGRSEKALAYYKNYVNLQDSAFQERQSELEQELELNRSFNQQQQRIELLEKNDDLNRKTIQILRQNESLARESMTNQRLLIYGLIAGILALAVTGYLMYKNMQQKKIANQLLALKSLRSQMNPHFIFNALNSVNHYISQKDERSANKYLSDFSRLMRAVLEHSQKDFITLQKETEIIALYLKLEHDRFREKFDFELNVDEELDQDHIEIPPMLVQPLVENAVWHGLRYRESKGFLLVHYALEDQQLTVRIEDNGIGREESARLKTQNQQKGVSTGMSNIEHRLQIINDMFRTSIKMEVIDLPNREGTRVILRMPLKPV